MVVKKKVTKKKPVKKQTNKKVTKKAVVSKKVKKQIATTNKKAIKANVKNVQQDKEIAKLKEEVAKLQGKNKKTKKKVNSKRISEYNLFIRKQINAGFTFTKAVKEWNRYQALMAKDKRRPSAYNQFIGSQMRIGKTFKQSVALWKLAKAGKLGRKGTTKTVEKIKYKTRTVKSKPKVIVRKVRSKPKIVEKIKYKTRTIHDKPEVIVRKVRSKPKIVEKIVYKTRTVKAPVVKTKPTEKIDYTKLANLFSSSLSTSISKIETVSKKDISSAIDADDEEIAFKIVQTYFKEIARFGFKKQLTLDEIVDAYLYALTRVKRNEHQELEVSRRVKEAGMRK